MTINKQFAPDPGVLEDCMDRLVEVLAQLLEEPENPAVDLPSGATGVTHGDAGKSPK